MRTLICMMLFAFIGEGAFAASTGPQPPGSYTVSSTSSPFSTTPLVGPTVLNLAQDSISGVQQPAGFSFTFFGNTYDRFRVGSNGYITLGNGATPTSTVAGSTPGVTTDGLVIAPLWLNYLGSGVQYLFDNANSTLIVRWGPVKQSGSSHGAPSSGTPPMSPAPGWVLFELHLYCVGHARDGEFEFHYGQSGTMPYGSTDQNSVCIADAAGSNQEIINASVSPHVGVNGEMETYPKDTVITYVPVVVNNPKFEMAEGSNPIAYNASATGTARDFGMQDIASGPTAPLMLTIINSGSASLTITSVSVTGADATEFVLDLTGMSTAIPASSSTQFGIAFDPTSNGTKTAEIEIDHSAANEPSPFKFEIAGTGTSPAPFPLIEVRQIDATGAVIRHGDLPSGNRNFGSVDLSVMPAGPAIIYVTNTGTAILNLGTVTVNSSEFMIPNGLPATLAPGASATFEVYFSATATGLHSGTVSIDHNDSTTGMPFEFGVLGTATSSSTGGPSNPTSGGGSSGGCVVGSGATSGIIMLLGVLAAATRRRKHSV